MEHLPAEVIFHIISFLTPLDLVRLQLVSRRFTAVSRENQLWKTICFNSSLAEVTRRRRERPQTQHLDHTAQLEALEEANRVRLWEARGLLDGIPDLASRMASGMTTARGRTRALANWDPSYPGERVDWYEEYIHRHGPISLSWLQQPRSGGNQWHGGSDVKGLAQLKDLRSPGSSKVVAPLDDGGVCLWDLSPNRGEQSGERGKIVARSGPGLLSVGPTYPSLDSSYPDAVECISVDSSLQRAYIAVGNALNEIDLSTLQVVSREKFPDHITALSDSRHPVPLTVGTNLSLHLHDPRLSARRDRPFGVDRLETVATFPTSWRPHSDFHRLFAGRHDSRHASLFQPGPLSILHMPAASSPGSPSPADDGPTDEIYVAGRFPSILNYDRRFFPRLRGTIHSGARLCSLAALPYPFKSLELDLMRESQLSLDDVHRFKSTPGRTLVAAGEYNGKGSLELYGLAPSPPLDDVTPPPSPPPPASDSDVSPGRLQRSTYKNRHTASRSKILTAAAHGTRLVFADGDGTVKWVERNGSVEARSWNINARPGAPDDDVRSLFRPAGGSGATPDHATFGDVARKLLPTGGGGGAGGGFVLVDDLLLWTGEKIGLLHFTGKPAFDQDEARAEADEAKEDWRAREERIYGQTMRRALERQADEARFVRGLGFGPRSL